MLNIVQFRNGKYGIRFYNYIDNTHYFYNFVKVYEDTWLSTSNEYFASLCQEKYYSKVLKIFRDIKTRAILDIGEVVE